MGEQMIKTEDRIWREQEDIRNRAILMSGIVRAMKKECTEDILSELLDIAKPLVRNERYLLDSLNNLIVKVDFSSLQYSNVILF